MVETAAISMELRKLTGYLCSSKSKTTLEICKQLLYTFVGPSHHVNEVMKAVVAASFYISNYGLSRIFEFLSQDNLDALHVPLKQGCYEAIFADPTPTKIFRHLPNSISVMQIIHYLQLSRSGGDRFLQYNHKTEKNLVIYNQSTPPEYQLSNVKTKIHFLYGTTDYITTYQDVELLIEEFKPWTIGISKLNGYNHLDFLIAKNVNELVNTKILDLINRYNN